MIRLKPWQWIILVSPIVIIITFLLIGAATQIHAWGSSWIWAVFTVIFVGWRWLLLRWTKLAVNQTEAVFAQVQEELESSTDNNLNVSCQLEKTKPTK